MKLKDILGQTDWQDVEADLTAYNLSPGKDIDAYRGVFESLSTMAPAQSGYILQMDIHRESPDFRIGYPVAYGVAKEDGRSRSLAFAPWAEWLGMEVDGRTFELFSFEKKSRLSFLSSNILCAAMHWR